MNIFGTVCFYEEVVLDNWYITRRLTDTRFCGVWVPLEFLRSTAEENQLILNFRSPLIDSRS